MGTVRQKKLAEAIIENAIAKKPKNKKELLVSAGYDVTTAEATPERTIQQKGVQEEIKNMVQALEAGGITKEFISDRIGVLLNAKKRVYDSNGELLDEQDDIQAIDKGLTHALKIGIGGGYAAEKNLNLNVDLTKPIEVNADYEKIREEFNEKMRQSLIDKIKGNEKNILPSV